MVVDNASISLQRLEVAADRLPLIGKQLQHVLGMKGANQNLVFEFIELVDRRIHINEDQLKRMLRLVFWDNY